MSAIPTRPQRHAISAAEFLRMGEAGVFATEARLELMDGEIIEMAPIGSAHAAVVNALDDCLHRVCGGSASVSVQNPIIVGERSVPQPDLALLVARADRYFHRHPTASDVLLVVEVADTTLRFDLGDKVPLYARAGIAEVWVVDIEKRAVHIFREPDGSSYRVSTTLVSADRLSVPGVNDASIGVSALFPP